MKIRLLLPAMLIIISSFFFIDTVKAEYTDPQFISQWGTLGSDDRQFFNLTDIISDSLNNIYVADSGNRKIKKFTNDGVFLSAWGTYQYTYVSGTFDAIEGLAFDSEDNIYVADGGDARPSVQKFTNNGLFLALFGTTTRGMEEGEFTNRLTDVAVDSENYVYILDGTRTAGSFSVHVFNPSGQFVRRWGSFGEGILGSNYTDDKLRNAKSIAIDSHDNIYIVDGNKKIKKFDKYGALQLVWGSGLFDLPQGIAVDKDDNIYVVDIHNHNIQIFNEFGLFLKKWGGLGSNEGQFYYPTNIAITDNYIYVADSGNNRIQKFSLPKSIFCNNSNYDFCDDFNSISIDTTKWRNITLSGLPDWTQNNGMLGRGKAVSIPQFTDFIYETKVSPSIYSSGADPIFRYQDRDNFYLFQIRPSRDPDRPYGQIVPHIRKNGSWIISSPLSNPEISIDSKTWYIYKVIGNGNVFDFYINNILIGSWTDTDNYFPQGPIGFRPEFYTHGVQYDYVGIKNTAPLDDIEAPEIIIIKPASSTEYFRSQKITIDYRITDNLSGLATTTFEINGQQLNTTTIDLFDYPVGQHQFKVTASDAVGNVATSTVNFKIITNLTESLNDLSVFYQNGDITQKIKSNLGYPLDVINRQELNLAKTIAERNLLINSSSTRPDVKAKNLARLNQNIARILDRRQEIIDHQLSEIDLEIGRLLRKNNITSRIYNIIKANIVYLGNNL